MIRPLHIRLRERLSGRGGLRGGVKLAAGTSAVAVVAVAAGMGAGVAAQPAGIDGLGVNAALASRAQLAPGAATEGGAGQVIVGKAVAISADPAGKALAKGLYTATNVAGSVSEKVKVPVGTTRPADISSISPLTTEGDSIVYDLNNSGDEVQTLVASGGQFKGELPVTLTVDLKVNGKQVDPTAATSITGDVELTYNFQNNTNRVEAIAYKDSKGRERVKNMNIAVPFNLSFDATFAKGWAQLAAPWANSGFSSGQLVTGSSLMMPSPLNGGNPNGQLKITGVAEDAVLPAANILVTPTSINGSVTSVLGKVASEGSKVDQLLAGKALPLLIQVQDEIGAASGTVAGLLETKINPILNLLSKLRLDPAKANALVEKGGADVAALGDVLLGANAATSDAAARVAELSASITSGKSQAQIEAVIAGIDKADSEFATVLPLLAKAAAGLAKVNDVLAYKITGAKAYLICPKGMVPCTVADVLKDNETGRLPTTCTTAAATNTLWADPQYAAALDQAIAYERKKPGVQSDLTQLKSLLSQQMAGPMPAGCVAAANGMGATLNGLVGSLGQVGATINDLLPLLRRINADLDSARAGLVELVAKMPEINRALDNACGATSVFDNLSNCGIVQALRLAAQADADASEELNERVLRIVKAIQPAIDKLFGIANTLGAAAMPLKDKIDQLPALLTQLAYGNVGGFVEDVVGLDQLAEKLSTSSSEAEAASKAIDASFQSGAGFPYGSATGANAQTMAVYEFKLAAAKPAGASVGAAGALALVLMIIGAGAAVWLGQRRGHGA